METPSLNILLVEDNLADARLLEILLQKASPACFTLCHTVTLAGALTSIRENSVDLIILDLHLPDAEGLEGLHAVIKNASDIPVVVYSGLGDSALIVEAIRQGAQDYFVKGQNDIERLRNVLLKTIGHNWILRGLLRDGDRLRRIIETTSDGILIIDKAGTIRFFNQAARTLIQREHVDLLGAPFGFPMVNGETTELEILQKDGNVVIVEMRIKPTLWDDDDAYLAALRDITAHKKLELELAAAKAQAEELAQLKASLLANMSHELRTPLTGILGFADTLMTEVPDLEHREFATIIKQAGNRLLRTINSILDYSELENGTFAVDKQTINVVDVVEEAVALLRPVARDKGLAIGVLSFAPDARLSIDKLLLQRILDNLVGNAIKFTDEGHVMIEVYTSEAGVTIQVKDTGCGISSDFVPHLFDEFRQESIGLQRSYEGSGLGLSITKKLVDLMRGTITVESEEGKGSIFSLTFPSTETQSATNYEIRS